MYILCMLFQHVACLFFDFHMCFWVFFHLILLQSVRKLQKDLAEKLSSKRCHSFPALKRGDLIDRYFPTAGMVILGVVIILQVLLRSFPETLQMWGGGWLQIYFSNACFAFWHSSVIVVFIYCRYKLSSFVLPYGAYMPKWAYIILK